MSRRCRAPEADHAAVARPVARRALVGKGGERGEGLEPELGHELGAREQRGVPRVALGRHVVEVHVSFGGRPRVLPAVAQQACSRCKAIQDRTGALWP